MTRAHDIGIGRPGNRIAFLAAVLLTAVTGAASFALAAPERASAGSELCPRAHFCIWEDAGYKGGMYNSGGSDRNLANNTFFNTDRIVANEGTALYNNGRKGRRDDVVVYMDVDDDIHPPRYTASFCVPRRKKIEHLVGFGTAEGFPWNDAIAGYRWVTDRECRAAGTR
jgi:Peptidase inhibitor family I36